jgi:hypothetical protein
MEREQTVVIGAMPVELQNDICGCGRNGRRSSLQAGIRSLVMLEFGCCECGEYASVRVARIVRVCTEVPTVESEGRIE